MSTSRKNGMRQLLKDNPEDGIFQLLKTSIETCEKPE
jgi:hypothetical protein